MPIVELGIIYWFYFVLERIIVSRWCVLIVLYIYIQFFALIINVDNFGVWKILHNNSSIKIIYLGYTNMELKYLTHSNLTSSQKCVVIICYD